MTCIRYDFKAGEFVCEYEKNGAVRMSVVSVEASSSWTWVFCEWREYGEPQRAMFRDDKLRRWYTQDVTP